MIETETTCGRCGSHKIAARLHGATANAVEIVSLQKGDMTEELSLVYNCGRDINNDKITVLETFFHEINYMRPTTSLIRLVLLAHETTNYSTPTRLLERCPYSMFFQTMEYCIKHKEITAPQISRCEYVWHPWKPQNEYRSSLIEEFLHNAIRHPKIGISPEEIVGLLPIIFAYYFPNIPPSIRDTIRHHLEQAGEYENSGRLSPKENMVDEIEWRFYYKLRNNMNLDNETIRELGFEAKTSNPTKTRIISFDSEGV